MVVSGGSEGGNSVGRGLGWLVVHLIEVVGRDNLWLHMFMIGESFENCFVIYIPKKVDTSNTLFLHFLFLLIILLFSLSFTIFFSLLSLGV